MKNNKVSNIRSVFVALFAALVAVSGFIAIPVGPLGVPIVLQNMMAVLTGALLGGIQGAGALGLFLLAGMLGLPVFSGGRGGIAHLLGPTGGFLTGYFIAALVVGLFIGKPSTEQQPPVFRIIAGCLLGYIVLYIPGIFQFMKVTGKPLQIALTACVIPYLPGDAIKLLVTIPLAVTLRPIVARYIFPEEVSLD